MEMIVTLVLASVLAAAIAAYVRIFLTGRPAEPFWFAPVFLLVIALVLVFGLSLSTFPIPGVVGQLISALMVAFAGWLWLGWRR